MALPFKHLQFGCLSLTCEICIFEGAGQVVMFRLKSFVAAAGEGMDTKLTLTLPEGSWATRHMQ